MPRLFRLDNGETIAEITDKQLAFLVDQLEEESEDDKDYFIDRDTLELLSDNGADPELLAIIEKAMGDDDEIDVAWDSAPAPRRTRVRPLGSLATPVATWGCQLVPSILVGIFGRLTRSTGPEVLRVALPSPSVHRAHRDLRVR